METSPTETPTTPLRQRMLDDMAMRSMRERTQHDYVRHVRAFAAFLRRSPDTATASDVRRFQVHQREHGVSESVTGATVSALRFLFAVTLDRPDLSRKVVLAPRPRKLPDVLSVEEVGRLLETAPGIKYRAVLGGAYGAGLRVPEVAHLGGRRHRQQAHVDPHRGGERPQGPQRDAVSSTARTAQGLVARGQTAQRPAAARLAVPGSQLYRPDLDTAVAPRGLRSRRGGGHPQAGQPAHAAAQLRHSPARTGRRWRLHRRSSAAGRPAESAVAARRPWL